MSAVKRRRVGTIAWVLLVRPSMILIGSGIWHAGWHIWPPRGTKQEEVWIGNRYILAGSALSIAAAVSSGARDNRLWVTVCVGPPRILVGWAMMDDPYDLKRHLAAVVSFPLALAGVAEVIRVRRRRQRD